MTLYSLKYDRFDNPKKLTACVVELFIIASYLLVDRVVDRQLDVQLTQVERERENEKELPESNSGSI